MSDITTPGPVKVNDRHTSIDRRSDVQVAGDRSFPNQAVPLYSLPTDAKEHNRLNYQHEMIKHLWNGSLYPHPEVVNKALSLDGNIQPNIIDIGTGSGVWAIDMARQFPHANVLGCDIVLPDSPDDSVPSNCRFDFLNVNNDMDKLQTIFNVVHWRLVEPATLDSDQFFYDVARILRPGGVFIAIAANPRLLDENGTVIPLKPQGDPEYCHFQHLMKKVYDYQFINDEPRMIHSLWNQLLSSNPNFKDFRVREFLVPTGPWEKDITDNRRRLAELMNENSLHVVPSLAAGLRLQNKWPESEINALEEGSLREYRELPPSARAYTKWVFATAVRTDEAWKARTEPWKLPEWFSPKDHLIPPLVAREL